MDLKPISFCDKISYNINNIESKKDILKTIEKYGINILDNKKCEFSYQIHKKSIINKPYIISLISSGNPYFLYLTKINGVNTSIFIDKKIIKGYQLPRMIFCRFRFDDRIFNNTLLDGELIKGTHGWKFLLTDCLIYSGKQCTYPILSRLNKIKKILFSSYIYDPFIECCNIKVKKFMVYDKINLSLLSNYIKSLDYKVNAILFQPAYFNEKGLVLSINKTKFIRKPSRKIQLSIRKPQNKTCCLLLMKTQLPGIYQLYCNKNGFQHKHSIARVNDLKCTNLIRDNIKSLNDKILVDCKYDTEFEKFVPINISNNRKPDDYKDIISVTNEKC